jgi:hypothetical protein
MCELACGSVTQNVLRPVTFTKKCLLVTIHFRNVYLIIIIIVVVVVVVVVIIIIITSWFRRISCSGL